MERTSGVRTGLSLAFVLTVAPGALKAQEPRSEQRPQFVASFQVRADVLAPTGLVVVDRKEPVVAALLSWLFPGVGNFYARNPEHGWRHVIIEMVGLGSLVVGTVQRRNDLYGNNGDALIASGYAVLIVNGIWSILSSIEDVMEYNRRVAGGGRGGGVALDVRPVFRALPGGGGPLTPPISRAGIEVVRLRF